MGKKLQISSFIFYRAEIKKKRDVFLHASRFGIPERENCLLILDKFCIGNTLESLNLNKVNSFAQSADI